MTIDEDLSRQERPFRLAASVIFIVGMSIWFLGPEQFKPWAIAATTALLAIDFAAAYLLVRCPRCRARIWAARITPAAAQARSADRCPNCDTPYDAPLGPASP